MDFTVTQLDDAVSRLLSSKEKETSFLCFPLSGSDSPSVGGYKVHLLVDGQKFSDLVEIRRQRDDSVLYLEVDASSSFGWKECAKISSTGSWSIGKLVSSTSVDISHEILFIGKAEK